MAEIKTSELEGVELAFWAAVALGLHPRVCNDGTYVIVDSYPFALNWSRIGEMVDMVEMTISGPSSPVHRNGGNNPGWSPRGSWSACTWVKSRHSCQRSIGEGNTPAEAVARCFVAHSLGRTFDKAEAMKLLEASASSATHKCDMCGRRGIEDPVVGCKHCGWDEMRPLAPGEV